MSQSVMCLMSRISVSIYKIIEVECKAVWFHYNFTDVIVFSILCEKINLYKQHLVKTVSVIHHSTILPSLESLAITILDRSYFIDAILHLNFCFDVKCNLNIDLIPFRIEN